MSKYYDADLEEYKALEKEYSRLLFGEDQDTSYFTDDMFISSALTDASMFLRLRIAEMKR